MKKVLTSSIRALASSAIVVAALVAAPVSADVLSVNYDDGGSFGFNENRSVQPVPGNPATTIGGQRRAVMEAAVAIWASRLDAALTARISAEFDDLGCGDRTTLGLGGPTWVGRDGSLPQQGINFPGPLVGALTGSGFSNADADINVTFNVRLDDGDCVDGVNGYWYGLDPTVAPAPGTFSFLELVLHEIGHGLGFVSLTDGESREFFEIQGERRPDVMSEFIFDIDRNRNWRELTASERVSSAVAGTSLTFTGPLTNERAAERLVPPGLITVSEPVSNLSRFQTHFHGQAPFLPLEGLSAPLRLPFSENPGAPVSTWDSNLACLPLTNAESIAGNIALVYRGECTFTSKVDNVTQAGAVGIIIVDNRSPGAEGAINGDQFMSFERPPSIPVYSVTSTVGTLMRGGLGGGRIYTLGYDLDQAPRGTRQNLVNLYSDSENAGSSVSHFSNRMVPRSLMNPSLSNAANSGDLDIVADFMHDLGWPDNQAKLNLYSGNWFNPARDGEGCQLTNEVGQQVPVLTCYSYRDGDPFWIIGVGEHRGDRYEFEMNITSGADYGSAFRPEDVVSEEWGSITMRLRDCNSARFEYRPDPAQGLAPFTTQKVKIVSTDCNRTADQQPDRRRTGNYFNPQRDGEGIQLAFEADANIWVMTWYTYLEGRQVWAIGTGTASGNRIDFTQMNTLRGGQWGLDFDPSQVETIPFGRIELDFLDCNRANMKVTPTNPAFEATEREMTRIVPRQC